MAHTGDATSGLRRGSTTTATRATSKAFFQGTERSVPPSETLERVTPLRSACGISRVANVTGLDRVGLPVVSVCRPNGYSVSVSMGKGATLEAAQASGLMEAIEGFHAERYP